MYIDIDKTQPKGFPNDTCLRSRLCRNPNSENVKLAPSLEAYGDFFLLNRILNDIDKI